MTLDPPPFSDPPLTGLALALAGAEVRSDAGDLAAAWVEQVVLLRLEGAARVGPGFGAHLRRSFLGALGSAASDEAQAGRPCPWDPPCALDVFCREQLRGSAGDGLPKPYVLRYHPEGRDLLIGLHVFGMAIDWAPAAAEALVAGLRSILPWRHALRGAEAMPRLMSRQLAARRIEPVAVPQAVRLVLRSPMDVSGRNPVLEPWTLLSRMIRRVDGVSRWNGVALDAETGRALAEHVRGLGYDLSGLKRGWHDSPNRRAEARRDPVVTGELVVAGDLGPIWPILRVAERCHAGRHAVEGLGWFELIAVR